MNITEYESLIDTIGTEYDLDISSSLLTKLSTRATEIEKEGLEFDDIFGEMIEIVPEDYRNEDNWQDFIGEIADEIFDSAAENVDDEFEDDEDDD